MMAPKSTSSTRPTLVKIAEIISSSGHLFPKSRRACSCCWLVLGHWIAPVRRENTFLLPQTSPSCPRLLLLGLAYQSAASATQKERDALARLFTCCWSECTRTATCSNFFTLFGFLKACSLLLCALWNLFSSFIKTVFVSISKILFQF